MLEPRDLPLLVIFAAVVRCGSFTAAARDLRISKSVVSDRVRMLEERCAVRLLERSTRRLRLTQVGEDVLAAATAVVDATKDVEAILDSHREAPVGTLRIASTHDLGARFVIPVAAALAARHPQLRVDIACDDAPQDLIAGRFDLGVRLGAPRDSGYAMRRLGTAPEIIVATPALADAHASVRRPRDLNGAPWACHTLVSRTQSWSFRGPRGERDEVAVSLRAQANTGDGLRVLLLGGVAFGVIPEYLITDELKRGALVRVCPEWMWRPATLYAALPTIKKQPKRVELFLSALREALAAAGFSAKTEPHA